jgi:hypothetical protein
MKHLVFRYRRQPVAVIKLSAIIPGAYDGMMVVCDDGATFASWPDGDRPREWIEGTPIPGTVRDMNRRDPVGRDRRPKRKPPAKKSR